MTERLTYEYQTQIVALEEDDSGARAIEMLIVPYGVTIRHGGRLQRYDRVEVDPERPPTLSAGHFPEALGVIGVLQKYEQRDEGLWGRYGVTDSTQAAREAYALAKEGILGDVSGEILVTNEAIDDSGDDPVSTLTGRLLNTALTTHGAFGDAPSPSKVQAVYDHDEGKPPMDNGTEDRDDVVALTADNARDVLQIEALEDEVRAMRQLIEDGPGNAQEARTIEAYEWFSAQVADQRGNRSPMEDLIEAYALAASSGTTGGSGDASGLMPEGWWAAGLVNVQGGWRPLFSRIGSMPFPTTGTSVGYPKVVSGPDVDKRSAQNDDANTEALLVDAASAGIQWFDGALRVPLELIEQSDPAIMAVIWSRLTAKLNGKVEAHAADVVAKGGTATGAVLTLTNYGTLVTDLVTTSEVIRQATDVPGDLLACSTADWIDILTMTDSSGRRIFSVDSPQNADGQGTLTAQSLDIGGIQAFHVPDLAESMQFNTEAAKGSDKGPRRLQNLNVEKVGVEVGLLGAAIIAPTITAGIQYYAAALPT